MFINHETKKKFLKYYSKNEPFFGFQSFPPTALRSWNALYQQQKIHKK